MLRLSWSTPVAKVSTFSDKDAPVPTLSLLPLAFDLASTFPVSALVLAFWFLFLSTSFCRNWLNDSWSFFDDPPSKAIPVFWEKC